MNFSIRVKGERPPQLALTGCTQLVLVTTLLMLFPLQLHAAWLSESLELMGTQVTVELWSEDEASGNAAIEEVFGETQRLDLMMNPWDPASELSRINREAGKHSVVTAPEIVEVVERALHYSRVSNGAFDISFASAGQHYDYKTGVAPNAEVLAQDRENIDYRAIDLNVPDRTITFTKPGLQIDLGGIAKGYAVDRGIEILKKHDIGSAIITAGGDSRILGDLGDRPRTIGIRHPRKNDEFIVLIPLADTAISTSGDYERFFLKDGVRYHHILDPDTGRSVKGVQSASVMTELAIDSDALSTTVFVLGIERGLELVNGLPDVDAIIIDGEGKLHYSAELLLNTTP